MTDEHLTRNVAVAIEQLNHALVEAADAGLHIQMCFQPARPGDGGEKPVTWSVCLTGACRIQVVGTGVTAGGRA